MTVIVAVDYEGDAVVFAIVTVIVMTVMIVRVEIMKI